MRQGSQRDSQQKAQPASQRGSGEVKSKRPDDKADRETRASRKAQEAKKIDSKQQSAAASKPPKASALAQDSKSGAKEAGEAQPGQKASQGAGGPSSDLFYKQKDTERNVLSGNEDDFWDEPDSVVAEIKASKKANIKVSESDFETDAHGQNQQQPGEQRKLTRQSEVRNSKRGMLSSNEQQNTSTSSN